MNGVRRAGVFLWAIIAARTLVAETVSAEVSLGERLFRETRFAADYASMAIQAGATAPVSCATCHVEARVRTKELAASQLTLPAAASARSAVPVRGDGQTQTVRHAQSLLGAVAHAQDGWGLMHWDGEFTAIEALIEETFLGRNFGWLPSERAAALKHFARVVRESGDGSELSYAVLLRGTDAAIPDEQRLPETARIDPDKASDEQIIAACARLVTAHLRTLDFARDADGIYTGSPYDAFLAANRLPRAPRPGEPLAQYTRRLHEAVAALKSPKFIDEPTRQMRDSEQSFRFGELELQGLRLFLRGTRGYTRSSSAGNCAECHVPPHFTDFAYHNTGASQDDYDAVHGEGAFAALILPELKARNAEHDRWLPATANHPRATGAMRSLVTKEAATRTDLGLWNIYGNPDFPTPQPVIERELNREGKLIPDEVLKRSLARFKTPTLRGLGQSAPYLHAGSQPTIEDVLRFYKRVSELAHDGQLRNAPAEFAAVNLEDADLVPLAAFLRSLNDGE